MIHYLTFVPVTVGSGSGLIESECMCADSQYELQIQHHTESGRGVIQLQEPLDDRSQYVVVNGQPFHTGLSPFTKGRWNFEIAQWVDARDMEEERTAKIAALKVARDAAEYGGFTWDGSTFDSDTAAQQRLSGALAMAQLSISAGGTYEVEWTLADNSVRAMTAADVIAAAMALAQHVAEMHATYRTLKAAALAATDLESLSAINWP